MMAHSDMSGLVSECFNYFLIHSRWVLRLDCNMCRQYDLYVLPLLLPLLSLWALSSLSLSLSLSSPQPPPPPPVVNPDLEVRSSRRVHNMVMYCPSRPDHRIRIHRWPPPPSLLHYMTRNWTWVYDTERSLIHIIYILWRTFQEA